MSLLMDALRKAEEAKSKASQEDKQKKQAGASGDPAGKSTPADPAPPPPAADHPAGTDKGPVVIDPDPDEEEILASHSADNGLELVPQEPEQPDTPEPEEPPGIDPFPEFEPAAFAPSGDDTGSVPENPDDEGEDDGLSLLQSSYFSRARKTGNSLTDDEPDQPEFDGNEEPAEEAGHSLEEEMQKARREPEPEQLAEDDPIPTLQEPAAFQEEADEPAAAPSQTGAAAGSQSTRRSGASSPEERQQRDSAGSLFRAKENSQKRRVRKVASIAAIVLVIPVAGIVYWLYTSLNSSSGMQFNAPANTDLASRSFSDTVAQTDTEPAQPGAETGQTGGPQNAPAPAAEDSTAASLMAAADSDNDVSNNDVTSETQEDPATAGVAPPVPGAQQAQVAAADSPAGQPPAQDTPAPPQDPAATTPVTPAQATGAQPDPGPADGQAGTPQTSLSITRSRPESVVNPDLNAAYDSYQQGDLATAGRLYQQVLSSDPNNRDAMLHLASVYLKQANAAMAQSLYARLLELNPRDPLARAGLLETLQNNPVRQEAELKALISDYPNLAPLPFALGNLYATQNRWNEAQSAYFDALLAAKLNTATGPVSPDYAFNLAVSLERISQLRAALDYYREAETLSRDAAPGFDPALLEQRMNTLEQRLQ